MKKILLEENMFIVLVIINDIIINYVLLYAEECKEILPHMVLVKWYVGHFRIPAQIQ